LAGKGTRELDQKVLVAFATSDFYQLLSVSLQWPSGELARAILDGSFREDGLSILAELGCGEKELQAARAALAGLDGEAHDVNVLLTSLRREYTRLFNHPEQPVLELYESVFLSRHNGEPEVKEAFVNPVAADVERCFREAGLVIKSREPADHLVAELEFMMYLYGNLGKARQEGQVEEADRIEGQIQAFVAQHLGKWCQAFFDRLEAQAQLPFYRAVGAVAQSGLRKVLPGPDALQGFD